MIYDRLNYGFLFTYLVAGKASVVCISTTLSTVCSVVNDYSFTVIYIFTAHRKGSFARAVYAIANPSVHLSVHTSVLCQNEGTQRDAVFTVG